MCPGRRTTLMASLLLGAGGVVEGRHRLFGGSKAAKGQKAPDASAKSGKAFGVSTEASKKQTKSSSSKAFKASKTAFDAPLQPPIESTSTPSPSDASTPQIASPPIPPPSVAPTLEGTSSSPTPPLGTPPSSCPLPKPAPSQPVPCQPTTGPCIAEASSLASVTSSMSDYDVVSLCGDIETERTIRIEASNATVCCASKPCRVKHSLTALPHQLMYVTGENFTLSGVVFEGGQGNHSVPGGGNIAIEADGSHLIEDSAFRNGTAPFHAMRPPNIGTTSGCGGNVFVETNHSVTVRGSTFSSGKSGDNYGGGLCVHDATSLSIEDSKFVDNESGGVMSHGQFPPGWRVSIYNSTFEGNAAHPVFVSTYGKMPSLRIHQTSFSNNEFGVSVCCGFDDVVLCDNTGIGEESQWCEHNIHVWGSSSEICVPLDEDYP